MLSPVICGRCMQANARAVTTVPFSHDSSVTRPGGQCRKTPSNFLMSQPNGVSSAHSTVVQPLGAKLTQNYIRSRAVCLDTLDRLGYALLLQLLQHLGAQDLVALSAAPPDSAAYCFATA